MQDLRYMEAVESGFKLPRVSVAPHTDDNERHIREAVTLNRVLGPNLYAGKVLFAVKARRRAANRVARRSRRVNRGR